ncbi:sel1 repeat family protein [Chryseobacterium nematophagum]|uniref:Sel1 repeat family protein n=1 Tax=Chryseobacterium nematophagum TaxID=2305228 RepID=A0A3M7TDV6_9FLAO|nr:sel1 repeat family protein [Chryseobacterium nematophagum]RNA61782.1 sel1 repeat family protein [Chryseobacterium nematophagum]
MENTDTNNADSILPDKPDTAKIIIDTASAFNKPQIEKFQKNVIDKGDVLSFNKLAIHYEDKFDYKELQKYALIMANQYNNGDGFSQAFVNIIAMNNNNEYDITNLAKLNEKAKSEALESLEKGAKLNDIHCMSMLAEIYRNGIGVEKDVRKADKLKKKIEDM